MAEVHGLRCCILWVTNLVSDTLTSKGISCQPYTSHICGHDMITFFAFWRDPQSS